jgi:hypothetical protein
MVDSSGIIGMYVGIVLIMVLINFVIYNVAPNHGWIGSAVVMTMILVFSSLATISVKSMSRQPLDWPNTLLTNGISVALIVLPTIALLYFAPVIGRAFGNTVGYMWINLFNNIDEVMKNVFGESSTRQFTELDEASLTRLIDTMGQKPSEENKMKLIELIQKKESVGKSFLVSLAAIIASLVSFLPSLYRF